MGEEKDGVGGGVVEEVKDLSNPGDQKIPLPHCISLTEDKIGNGNGLAQVCSVSSTWACMR